MSDPYNINEEVVEEPGRKRRMGLIMALTVGVVVLGYLTVLFLGGRALEKNPFTQTLHKIQSGLKSLNNSEPPRGLAHPGPLIGSEVQVGATPSPIQPRVTPSPSPSLSPRVIPPAPDAPSTLTFTIDYENTTGLRITGVQITDRVPSGTAFKEGSPSPPASFDGTTLVWNIGTLDPGQTGRVSFQVYARSTRVTNRAVMTSNEAPPSSVETSATV